MGAMQKKFYQLYFMQHTVRYKANGADGVKIAVLRKSH